MKQHKTYPFLIGACLTLSMFTPALGAAPKPPKDAIQTAIQLEDAFSFVADKARDAVVVITNTQSLQQGGMPPNMNLEDFFFNPYFRRQFRSPRRRQRSFGPTDTGSGAIISKDGYIVTNCHVIENSEFLKVKLADGTVYDNQRSANEVKIIGMDKESDLAVIQIGNGEKHDFHFLEFADSDKLKVGQWAIAVGAPHQLEQSVTIGNVSQIGRHNRGISAFNNYIQTDASLNPGNSGGPLLDINGNIIGINQFIQTDGTGNGNIGLGFAIASNVVRPIVFSLMDSGEVSRPFIGISMQDLTDELKPQFNVESGILVSEVISGEAAEKAGIQVGDVITAVNGQTVKDSQALLIAITNYKPGDTIKLNITRGDKQLEFKVIAGKRALADNSFKGSRPTAMDSTQFAKLGLELSVLNGDVIIDNIKEDGAAAEAAQRTSNGLMPGDIIREVNRKPVKTVNDVQSALRLTKNNTVVMLIERSERGRDPWRLFVAIPLD